MKEHLFGNTNSKNTKNPTKIEQTTYRVIGYIKKYILWKTVFIEIERKNPRISMLGIHNENNKLISPEL